MRLVHRLLLALSLTLGLGSAHALDIQPYSADALSAAQQAGQPVALHFHADWCPTCRAQTKVFHQFSADKVLDMTLLVV
ncbi:MAG: thioredoxin family protein, partial [Hylemonella sp.]|nr:thioredoxin family protein [Hylemonella sp.]